MVSPEKDIKERVYSEEVTASHSFTKPGKNLIYTVLMQAPLPRSAVGYDDDSLQKKACRQT